MRLLLLTVFPLLFARFEKNFNLLFCFIVFIVHKLFSVFRRCVSGSWLFFHFSLLHVWRSPSWQVEPHLFSSDLISSVLITPFKTALIIIIKTVFIIVFWSNQFSIFLSMLSISCTSNEQSKLQKYAKYVKTLLQYLIIPFKAPWI